MLPLTAACSEDPGMYSAAEPVVAVPERAAPSSTFEVTVALENTGDVTWTSAEVALVGSEDAAGFDLQLADDSAAGSAATFKGQVTAPAREGQMQLAWSASHAKLPFGPSITASVTLACADGSYCNGVERFVGGRCLTGPAPCDDDAPCTVDSCDEGAQRCGHIPTGECAICSSSCVADCTDRVCGDDGCGGSCGSCDQGEGCAAVSGTCQPATTPGTCASPLPLLTGPLVGRHLVDGDSTAGVHQAVPACNSTSTSVELVYSFTTSIAVGLDARSSGFDTVLHVRKEDPSTPANDCLDDEGSTVACSDDASPPGDYGSRVAVRLDPGTYYLIVDGFDSTQYGPFSLDVRFAADGCVPSCDGVYCGGDDGCGGSCGACGDGFACVDARCQADPCIRACDGKECGDDGCGGVCGSCTGGELCVPATGACEAFAACDHMSPVCAPACGPDEFCGSDCACRRVDAALPDLVVNEARLADEILFDHLDVDPASCAVAESCVLGTGMRRLLRFSVEAVNQGQATLEVPLPDTRPDLFQFSRCHGHYHFEGFATYGLLDLDGNTVLEGRKQAYCMEDTIQFFEGPSVSCEKAYDCFTQGIQAGWSDLYGNALDCQWLDITDVPPGEYLLEVRLNPNHAFEEVSKDNNRGIVRVTIPAS